MIDWAEMPLIQPCPALLPWASATTTLAEIAEGLVRGALSDYPEEETISLLAISISNLEEQYPVSLL